MKRQIKTYGVYGMVEWQSMLAVGKAKMAVHFRGGSTTTQGVIPATFSTDNPVVQLAIEHTAEYLGGRIKTVRVTDLTGEVILSRNEPAVAEAPVAENTTTVITEPYVAPSAETLDVAEEEAPDHTVVKVGSLRDAAEYIRDHYDIPISKLRSGAAIEAAAAQYGVEFEYVRNAD